MLSSNRFALKEGVSACDRLARGEAVVLLRKGGLRERRGGFEVEHREFFLFPTRFHERGEAPPSRVELSLYAVVEAEGEVGDLETLRRLDGLHPMSPQEAEKRFFYRSPGVRAVALRAWRLDRPPAVENAAAYDGCVSWVELDAEREPGPATPALDDRAFAERLSALQAALRG